MPRYIFSNGTVQTIDSKGALFPKKNKRSLQSGVLIFTSSIDKNASQPDISTKGKPENDAQHESQE